MLRIKEILKEKNMTLTALSEELGIHRVTLTQTISGNPTLETLEKIAKALDVDVIDLFEDKRPKIKDPLYCPHCQKPISIELKEFLPKK